MYTVILPLGFDGLTWYKMEGLTANTKEKIILAAGWSHINTILIIFLRTSCSLLLWTWKKEISLLSMLWTLPREEAGGGGLKFAPGPTEGGCGMRGTKICSGPYRGRRRGRELKFTPDRRRRGRKWGFQLKKVHPSIHFQDIWSGPQGVDTSSSAKKWFFVVVQIQSIYINITFFT